MNERDRKVEDDPYVLKEPATCFFRVKVVISSGFNLAGTSSFCDDDAREIIDLVRKLLSKRGYFVRKPGDEIDIDSEIDLDSKLMPYVGPSPEESEG